jgi:membrane protease YdiL (CAAX protease family)
MLYDNTLSIDYRGLTKIKMKKLFQTYPNISRLILGALLILLALILSGFIPNIPHLGEYFPFVGNILVVTATWFMYHTENQNLSALGFDLKKRNILFLPIGLILGIIAFVAGFYFRTFITGEQWNINYNINYKSVLQQLYWVLPTAAVQEFIVRGYCFKKIIEMSNQTIGIIMCGLLFISMHEFWNGNIVQIIAFAATLFIGHLMFSAALLKSKTIYFAIGLHWGNNIANSNLFTEGRKDTSIIFTTNQHANNMNWTQFGLLFLSANIGFIILTLIIWKWKPKPIAIKT